MTRLARVLRWVADRLDRDGRLTPAEVEALTVEWQAPPLPTQTGYWPTSTNANTFYRASNQ